MLVINNICEAAELKHHISSTCYEEINCVLCDNTQLGYRNILSNKQNTTIIYVSVNCGNASIVYRSVFLFSESAEKMKQQQNVIRLDTCS